MQTDANASVFRLVCVERVERVMRASLSIATHTHTHTRTDTRTQYYYEDDDDDDDARERDGYDDAPTRSWSPRG